MPTAKIQMTLMNGYKILFNSHLGKFLGFQETGYTVSSMSENNVDISSITSINILCDLIGGTYQDGKKNQCLYNFPYGTVPHGFRIIQQVSTPIYLPIITRNISDIRFKIVDQNGKLINFNNEKISLSLHLKQV